MSEPWNIAVVGVTGEVGKAVLALLDEADLPLGTVHALASAEVEDASVLFKNRPLFVHAAADFDFSQVQAVVLATPAEVSQQLVPRAQAAGCIVIDHSSAFRLDGSASLTVAGINTDALPAGQPLIACADASAAILAPVLAAIDRMAGLVRVQITVLRAVSARGRAGLRELAGQTGELLNARGIDAVTFPQQVAFNLLPLLGVPDALGRSVDEAAIADELRELLGRPELAIDVSCVTVPVFYGHAAQLHVETLEYIDPAEAARRLAEVDGLSLQADADEQTMATPVTEAAGHDATWVCRLRPIAAPGLGIQAWVLADNVRQGAARHTVQILRELTAHSKKSL
jgi:aspartate-semialdehyde dehydrogenase